MIVDPKHRNAQSVWASVVGTLVQGGMSAGSQQSATQGEGPWSDADYRNGADIESDIAYETRRSQEWAQQNDGILTRRAQEIAVTPEQRKALMEGAGPLNAGYAREWVAFDEGPIGPAANGRMAPATKAQKLAAEALRARIAKTTSDFVQGSGEFAPTTSDSQSLTSALKDTSKAIWNIGVDVLALSEMGDPFAGLRRAGYRSLGIELPNASEFRANYDTPAFGLTMEVLAPMVPVKSLLGGPRQIGGAAFVEGKFMHDLKPLSNLELYGTAATRTPDEALQLLARVGHEPEVLAQYRIVKLTDEAYARKVEELGFHFDATYGTVPKGAPSVSFDKNIASQMADRSSKIPVYVRKDVFDSDEKIVQILSHEISETQELRYVAAKPISVKEYKAAIAQNIKENLHWHAVKDGDVWLQRFRDMLAGKR
jgi:hypothetical protein